MDITPIDFKWGTAPPVTGMDGKPMRAFGLATAQVIQPARWAAILQENSISTDEDALPLLRQSVTQALQACLAQYAGNLPAFGLLVQSQAAQAFQQMGLELTRLEVQSLESAETLPEPAFRDPAPAQILPLLPLNTFGIEFPVDDIRFTPPEEPDEPRT